MSEETIVKCDFVNCKAKKPEHDCEEWTQISKMKALHSFYDVRHYCPKHIVSFVENKS